MIEQIKPECELKVDGGIDEASAPMAVAAGANVLVAGSSIFGANRKWLTPWTRYVRQLNTRQLALSN